MFVFDEFFNLLIDCKGTKMVRRDTASSILIRPMRPHVQSNKSTACCSTRSGSRCFRGAAAKLTFRRDQTSNGYICMGVMY